MPTKSWSFISFWFLEFQLCQLNLQRLNYNTIIKRNSRTEKERRKNSTITRTTQNLEWIHSCILIRT